MKPPPNSVPSAGFQTASAMTATSSTIARTDSTDERSRDQMTPASSRITAPQASSSSAELLLACGAVILLLAGVIWSRERSSVLSVLAIVLLVAVIALAVWKPAEGTLFGGGFIVDGFSRYMK